MCLPHCPTYRLYLDENASPRGRIALAEALLKGDIQPDASAKQHIDQCLLCLRCEQVCPSQVKYHQIIDTVRQQWSKPSGSAQLAKRPKLFSTLNRLAQAIPNAPFLPVSFRLAKALKTHQTAPQAGIYPPSGKPRARIGLLLGCATRAAQASALHAAIRLLNTLGYTVVIPAQQGCCGALAAHQGDQATAITMADKNHQAFAKNVDIVLTTASGCASYWRQQASFALPANDIVVFLAQPENADRLTCKPLRKTAALHQPCSLVNGLNQSDALASALKPIPELTTYPLSDPGDCCGASGDHLLTHRKQAEALRQPLLDKLDTIRPDYLVTTNIGCALHLAEGMNTSGLATQVMHPVELLEKQL